MSYPRASTVILIALAMGAAMPAAQAETSSNGCVVTGPNKLNVYQQAMNFSVNVDPTPVAGHGGFEVVNLVSPSAGLVNSVFMDLDTSKKSMFMFSTAHGAHYGLTYGTIHEVMDGTGGCGALSRPITVKAATRPYVSSARSGRYVKVNGTVEFYNKDATTNYYNYGRWDRINRTYLDFQRLEGGRWVTKKSVLTDARGNANTGWMNYPSASTWRVQYRGGWWLQATSTGSSVR